MSIERDIGLTAGALYAVAVGLLTQAANETDLIVVGLFLIGGGLCALCGLAIITTERKP